jgi:hypothetical protein
MYKASNTPTSDGGYMDSDDLYEVLDFKDDDGVYLGYGPYQEEIGKTYVAGNEIVLLANQGIEIEPGKDLIIGGTNLSGLIRAMTQTYQLTAVGNTQDIQTSSEHSFVINRPSATAKLFGNNLYVRFRNTPAQSDNPFKNGWFIGGVVIQHGGKITDCEYVNNLIDNSTAMVGLRMINAQLDDTKLSFDVFLYCPENTEVYSALTTFNIPVTLNLNAFTE